jgi:GT2 family glycosyltransferase
LDGKVDVVMWAKNGATMLTLVLKRASEVLPDEIVNKRIFVDDRSTDGSREIAKDFGWTVYDNEHGGIGCGVNTALRHVECERFISLEQDLVLARNWLERVPPLLEKPKIAAAQGTKLSEHPVLRKIDEFSFEQSGYTLRSIDNTLYDTKVMKTIVGTIPEHFRYGAVDSYMRLRLEKVGLKWVVDPKVVSIHLRQGGLREQIARHYKYGLYAPRRKGEFVDETETKRAFKIAVLSPLRALEIIMKKRCPQALYYYPLMRFAFLGGALRRN